MIIVILDQMSSDVYQEKYSLIVTPEIVVNPFSNCFFMSISVFYDKYDRCDAFI